ncbi:MAG: hypothetical protein Roseis2KO_55520 [Roseivirga sp.]
MKQQDYTSFSDEILREKHRRANLTSKIFLGIMILLFLASLTLMLLLKEHQEYTFLIIMLAPVTIYYGKKAKAIKAELSKRTKL